MPEITAEEALTRVFAILTELALPKWMDKLPPALYMEIVSLRMDLSPTTIRESMTIPGETRDGGE